MIRLLTVKAEYYSSQYRYDLATKYVNEALAVYKEMFGESKNHTEYLGILRKQAKIAKEQARFQEALEIADKIEAI